MNTFLRILGLILLVAIIGGIAYCDKENSEVRKSLKEVPRE